MSKRICMRISSWRDRNKTIAFFKKFRLQEKICQRAHVDERFAGFWGGNHLSMWGININSLMTVKLCRKGPKTQGNFVDFAIIYRGEHYAYSGTIPPVVIMLKMPWTGQLESQRTYLGFKTYHWLQLLTKTEIILLDVLKENENIEVIIENRMDKWLKIRRKITSLD